MAGWGKTKKPLDYAAGREGRDLGPDELAKFAEQLRAEREREQQGREAAQRRRQEERQRAGYE
jgi:hypothetical protein